MYTQVTGFPGKVQGHGVFFLLEEGPGARIKAVSSNAVMLFRGTPEGLLGKAFTTLFSKPDALQGALAPGANISHLTPLTLEVALPANRKHLCSSDCSARHAVQMVCWRTSRRSTQSSANPAPFRLRSRPRPLSNPATTRQSSPSMCGLNPISSTAPTLLNATILVLCAPAVARRSRSTEWSDTSQVSWEVFKIFGYDRVLVFKFLEDRTCHVIAERRCKAVKDAWLNLHWPATDVATSARVRHQKKMSSVVVDAMVPPKPPAEMRTRMYTRPLC